MSVKTSKLTYSVRQSYDADLARYLHAKIFPTDEWYDRDTSVYWIVWDNYKRPVGFCMLAPVDKEIVFLSRAGLLKEARGKGLHMRMLKVRERWCKKMEFNTIITYTVLDNIRSSYNLQKAGYFLYEPEYKYASDENDCLYWIKEI
jgi:GNAT superfamily N-acetyltransferase